MASASSIAKHSHDNFVISQPSLITNKETPLNSLPKHCDDKGTPSPGAPSPSSSSSSSRFISHIISWLDKRKKQVPDTLLASTYTSVDSALHLLPSLRERERRALVRHVEKCMDDDEFKKRSGNNSTNKTNSNETNGASTENNASKGGGNHQNVMSAEWGSDGEYDYDVQGNDHDSFEGGGGVAGVAGAMNATNNRGGTFSSSSWPNDIEFSNNYRWDARVPEEVKNKYSPGASSSSAAAPSISALAKSTKALGKLRQRASHPSKKVYYQIIRDQDHPAYGEYGLYCALPNGAPPGTWLLDYIGHISLGEHQDKTSNYVSDFGINGELSVDAATYGNESRFLNDYRNTGKYANVEFKLRWDACGELRQGVYVKQRKESRDPNFRGVAKDEELLVSYGRSYWRSRVGNLTDFVWRLPGMPMPESRQRSVHPDEKELKR